MVGRMVRNSSKRMIIPETEQFIPFLSLNYRRKWERKNCDLCTKDCHIKKTVTYKEAKEIGFIFFTYFSDSVKTIKLNDCKAKIINSNPVQE